MKMHQMQMLIFAMSIVDVAVMPSYDTHDVCIYTTTTSFLDYLEKDPFGDMCKRDSEYVKKTCCPENTCSRHMCTQCSDRSWLPSICFCDKTTQCPVKNDYSPRGDEERKISCRSCFNPFNFTFGKHVHETKLQSCKTDLDQLPIDRTVECKDGFTGPMCSSIKKRVCNKTLSTNGGLANCNATNDNKCNLYLDDVIYLCQDFISKHVVTDERFVECGTKVSINTLRPRNDQLKPSVSTPQCVPYSYIIGICLLMCQFLIWVFSCF